MPSSDASDIEASPSENDVKPAETSTETSLDDDTRAIVTNGIGKLGEPEESERTKRFDALVREREALQAEVTKLRQSLESLQEGHARELEEKDNSLHETQTEKEQAEEQYQNLLGKVNTIRSQLGERLKADAVSSLKA